MTNNNFEKDFVKTIVAIGFGIPIAFIIAFIIIAMALINNI